VGNKADLESMREAKAEDAEAVAASTGYPHFVVSAKMGGTPVQQVFQTLAESVSPVGRGWHRRASPPPPPVCTLARRRS